MSNSLAYDLLLISLTLVIVYAFIYNLLRKFVFNRQTDKGQIIAFTIVTSFFITSVVVSNFSIDKLGFGFNDFTVVVATIIKEFSGSVEIPLVIVMIQRMIERK